MKFVDIQATVHVAATMFSKFGLYYREEGVYYVLSYLDTEKDDILHRSYVHHMVLTCQKCIYFDFRM